MTTIGTNPLFASTLPPSLTTRGTNERLGDES